MATPNITLTVTLEDFTGVDVANGALVIRLCGFGQTLPRITGTAMLAKISEEFRLATGTTTGISLYGNDQITPLDIDGSPLTYYSITVMDDRKNVVQSGIYQFTGTETIDLSDAPQLQMQPAPLVFFDDEIPGGAINSVNRVFSLPAAPNPVSSLQVFLNGALTIGWSVSGDVLTYDEAPQEGDTHVVFFRSRNESASVSTTHFQDDIVPAGAIDGVNTVFTLPSAPSPAASLQLFLNSLLTTGYTLVGNTITYDVAPQEGDTHVAFYRD